MSAVGSVLDTVRGRVTTFGGVPLPSPNAPSSSHGNPRNSSHSQAAVPLSARSPTWVLGHSRIIRQEMLSEPETCALIGKRLRGHLSGCATDETPAYPVSSLSWFAYRSVGAAPVPAQGPARCIQIPDPAARNVPVVPAQSPVRPPRFPRPPRSPRPPSPVRLPQVAAHLRICCAETPVNQLPRSLLQPSRTSAAVGPGRGCIVINQSHSPTLPDGQPLVPRRAARFPSLAAAVLVLRNCPPAWRQQNHPGHAAHTYKHPGISLRITVSCRIRSSLL